MESKAYNVKSGLTWTSYEDLYAHFIEPMVPVDNVPHAVKEIARYFRPLYKGTFIINCGFESDSGSRVIEEGHAHAVSFGKYFISNPDLVERIRLGSPLILPDVNTFYTPGPKGYTDYPGIAKPE